MSKNKLNINLPLVAKKKDGNKIKKLPAAFKVISEYENDFKKDYIDLLSITFSKEIDKILNIEK